jgi:hypothetical protein
MRKLIIISLILKNLLGYSQGSITPSPDAMGLAKYANIPINYYTGTPGINIPLASVGGKEINVPVSLSYNASGHKVQEIASSVGLGWSLNAGGLITRIVRGLPDDLSNGYCTSSSTTDTEPDLFYYNFLGQTGKFIVNRYGNSIITIPFRKVVIKPGICKSGSNGTWEIIDENGFTYRFGVTSSERETTTTTEKSGASKTVTSSWYLSEIVSPNSTERVNFSYLYSQHSYTNYSFIRQKDPCHNDEVQDWTTTVVVNSRQVSSIVGSLGSIYFTWQSGRRDAPYGYLLSSMQLSNSSSQQISKLKFQYGYFQSTGCSTTECFRLRLDKIFDLAPDALYSFTYNTSINLPSIKSQNIDNWGYYNNNTVASWLPEITSANAATLLAIDPSTPFNSPMPGASRVSDASKTLANILTRIDERGGGYKTFSFEAHMVERAGSNVIVGGARINATTINDGKGNSITKQFRYLSAANPTLSSGTMSSFPPRYLLGYLDSNGILFRYLLFSNPLYNVFDLNGVHVGYSRVEEIVSGNGRKEYFFTNFVSNPDVKDPGTGEVSDFSWQRGNLLNERAFNESGRMLSTQNIEYNTDSNQGLISWSRTIYWGWDCGCGLFCSNTGNHNFTYKNISLSRPFTVKKQTKETYDLIDPSKKMVSITEYQYDPITYLQTKTIQYDNVYPSKKYITQAKYVTDPSYNFNDLSGTCSTQFSACIAVCGATGNQASCFTNCLNQRNICSANNPPPSPTSAAIIELKNRNQVTTPVETISIYQDGVNTKVLSSAVNKYSLQSSRIFLNETWSINSLIDEPSFNYSKILSSGAFDFDTRMRKVQTNNTYDNVTGNLLQQTSFDGVQTNYTWGYNNNLVTSTTSSGGVNSRTSSSTYKPMVGALTATDANGRTTTQEYDVYNRLSITKDHDGNILKRVRYHYANETPSFVLSISPNRTEAITNEILTFSVTDVAASTGGTPQFTWDLGNGTVVNNSTSFSYAYTVAGTYTVKLLGINPEYGTVVRSVQVTISNPLSATICEDGPVWIDLCGNQPPSYGPCTITQDPYASTLITATPSGGCASVYNYYWEYRNASNNYWNTLYSSVNSVTFYPPSVEGSYEVRCTITDACGNTTQLSSNLSAYKSDPNCSTIGIR